MDIIAVTPETLDSAVRKAAQILKAGGVVVYPTDTAYGFAAHGLQCDIFDKIFALKGRSHQNPIHLIVSDLDAAAKISYMNEQQRRVLQHWLPGPLTFVLSRREIVPAQLVAGGTTIGIRIPNHPVTQRLSQLVAFPYTATSANVSGQPAVYNIPALLSQFPPTADIPLILDYGQLPTGQLSTVIDIVNWPQYQIVRPGAISQETFAKWAKSV